MPIRAVIFDLNGVFILSPKLSERFEADFGVPKEEFLPVLRATMEIVRLPNAPSLYASWKPHFDTWGVSMNEEEFERYWFRAERENTEMVRVAREIKSRGIKLFILSNNLRERQEYYDQNFPFLSELFEKVYFSWQTGFIKPDTRAYTSILEGNNLAPEECMYFDDAEENVAVARELGIQSHLFTSVDDVRKKLLL